MSDLIDRQAAIYAVKCGALSAAMVYGRTDAGSTALSETVKAIKALPTAQPEYTEQDMRSEFSAGYDCGIEAARHEIIRCKDCEHYAGEGMYCAWDIMVHYDHFYCYHAERRTDD